GVATRHALASGAVHPSSGPAESARVRVDKVRASKLLSAEEHTRLRQWGRDAAYAARTARLEKTMANNLIKRLVDTRPYYGDLAVALLRVGFGLSMAFAHGLAKVANLSGF